MTADSSTITDQTFKGLSLDWATALAARHADAPMALLSVLLPEGVEYLAVEGLPVDARICSLAVRNRPTACEIVARTGEPFAIHDLGLPGEHLEIAELMAGVGMQSYYGVPLYTPSNVLIGSLCVGDSVPRRWNAGETENLAQLASAVSLYLEWAISEQVRNRIKLTLPSALSHSVRTSLTGMQASLEMLAFDSGELNESQGRMVDIAYRKCMDLVATCEQLLAITEQD